VIPQLLFGPSPGEKVFFGGTQKKRALEMMMYEERRERREDYDNDDDGRHRHHNHNHEYLNGGNSDYAE
jgi:hypothetical protein